MKIQKQTIVNNYKTSHYPVPAFKGHFGTEKYGKNGIKELVKETGFFRNLQTKEFVVDYIRKNFSHKPNIRMLVGACSSGEEAYTYSMLLDDIKEKLSITGFDLGNESIKQALSKKCIMMKQRENKEKGIRVIHFPTESLKDSYLCFNRSTPLTTKETALKDIFNKYFELTDETVPSTKISLSQKINIFILRTLWGLVPPEFDQKVVKLRNNKATNCSFMQGDILELDKIANGEKADIITFTNAMYHLICDNVISGGWRFLKKNAEETVQKLVHNIKENLNPNGIFVLGEDELLQTLNSDLVPKILKKEGFEPLNKTSEHEANVWKLK